MTALLWDVLCVAACQPVSHPDRSSSEDFGHYCVTHIFDRQCVADPAACRAFCGCPDSLNPFFTDNGEECVVCAAMCEARGDFDLSDPEADDL